MKHAALLAAVAMLSSGAHAQTTQLLGVAPTYDSRRLGPTPNAQAIKHRIWAPGLNEGYVPQGLTVVGHNIYVSSYLSDDPKQGRGPCRVFKIDIGTGLVTASLDLPQSCGHAGGMAKGPANTLYVSDTTTLYEIQLLQQPKLGHVKRSMKLQGPIRGSYIGGDAEGLWFGEFKRDAVATLYHVPYANLSSSIGLASATKTVALPSEVQGAEWDQAGKLWITRSTSKYGELLRLNAQDGVIEARYPLPAAVEGLSFDHKGALWTLSEAGSKRWSNWKTFFPVIFEVDVAKLK